MPKICTSDQKKMIAELCIHGESFGVKQARIFKTLQKAGYKVSLRSMKRWSAKLKGGNEVIKTDKNTGKQKKLLSEWERRVVAGFVIDQYLEKMPNDTLTVKSFISSKLGKFVKDRFVQRLYKEFRLNTRLVHKKSPGDAKAVVELAKIAHEWISKAKATFLAGLPNDKLASIDVCTNRVTVTREKARAPQGWYVFTPFGLGLERPFLTFFACF